MRIGIITVNNSHNYGSYLQARALYTTLSSYGNVFLIDTKTRNMRISYKGRIKSTYRASKNPLKFVEGVLFETIEYKRISKLWDNLVAHHEEQYDLLVIGSDEMWNITRKSCLHDIFWGEGFSCRKIAYAPSVNNASSDDFRGSKYVGFMDKMDYISVRDLHSKEVLQVFHKQDIPIVLDPTLLHKPSIDCWKVDYPYIAVYLLTDIMSEEEIEGVKAFSRMTGLKLISAGRFIPWCDKCIHSIEGNPFHVYKNAKYVITNSFHGTAFAINYNKNFVSFGNRNLKIRELTKQFGIQEKAIDCAQQIPEQLEKGVNYTVVNNYLKEMQQKSLEYLEVGVGVKR